MREYHPFKSGKVREIYDNGDTLIMVSTDRISAFDVVLSCEIPGKGRILNGMSEFWFHYTKDLVPNHMITTDINEMPDFFRACDFRGRSMMVKRLTMLPIECIVRGYITGSGWESYIKHGTVCGIELPKGLSECGKLPEALYTPSTKADLGLHDENIDFEKSIEVLQQEFPGQGRKYAEAIRDLSLALYNKCADYALERGIIIADTKFEFGLDDKGDVILGDEMLTPDSSRFWPAEGYEPGHSQPSFDKQFVRDYLKSKGGDSLTLPQYIIDRTAEKYEEAYTLLTGKRP